MKMVVGYARLLRKGDALLEERGLSQPANAEKVCADAQALPSCVLSLV